MPVELPTDASFAIARGAAQTAAWAGSTRRARRRSWARCLRRDGLGAGFDATQMAPAADATQMATAADGVVGPLLAYSQDEPDYYEMPAESLEEFVPEQADEATYTAVIAPPPPRTLLVGSAMAFLVMSFTTLAVAVAVNIRPVADVRSAAGTARAVGYGAGALPAAGAARAGSGGVAGRGGVAGARRSGGSACPDQPGAGAQ